MSAQFENVLDYFHAARCSAEWRNSKQWKTILLLNPFEMSSLNLTWPNLMSIIKLVMGSRHGQRARNWAQIQTLKVKRALMQTSS